VGASFYSRARAAHGSSETTETQGGGKVKRAFGGRILLIFLTGSKILCSFIFNKGHVMTASEIIKKLKAAGWVFTEGKKHTKGIGPDGRTTRIWRHAKDIPTGTLAEIEKQTGVKLR
jgi:predicted RNA binding protein YcfA (HicA-like mRNA interferase family)